MKHIAIFLVLAATSIAAHSHGSAAADTPIKSFPEATAQMPLRMGVSGFGAYPLDPGKSGPMFFEVPTSAKLTEAIRAQLKGMGFRLAETEEQGMIKLRLRIGYEFRYQGAEPLRVDLAEATEHAQGDAMVPVDDRRFVGVAQGLNPMGAGLRGVLSGNTALPATLYDEVIKEGGHALTIKAAQDPSAVACNDTTGCRLDKGAEQEVRVVAYIEAPEGRSVVRGNAKGRSSSFIAEPLYHAAMIELANRLRMDEARPGVPAQAVRVQEPVQGQVRAQ